MRRVYGWLSVCWVLAFPPLSFADQGQTSILAPWQAEGKVYKVGPTENQFIGVFKGIMYVETKSGELDTALFVCPATHVLNVETKTTKGTGRCHIVAAAGNVFGTFNCTGKPGYCDGRFEITGGTDEFDGITGASDIEIRMALSVMMRDTTSGDVVAEAEGLAVWPNLKYSIPGAK